MHMDFLICAGNVYDLLALARIVTIQEFLVVHALFESSIDQDYILLAHSTANPLFLGVGVFGAAGLGVEVFVPAI